MKGHYYHCDRTEDRYSDWTSHEDRWHQGRNGEDCREGRRAEHCPPQEGPCDDVFFNPVHESQGDRDQRQSTWGQGNGAPRTSAAGSQTSTSLSFQRQGDIGLSMAPSDWGSIFSESEGPSVSVQQLSLVGKVERLEAIIGRMLLIEHRKQGVGLLKNKLLNYDDIMYILMHLHCCSTDYIFFLII